MGVEKTLQEGVKLPPNVLLSKKSAAGNKCITGNTDCYV